MYKNIKNRRIKNFHSFNLESISRAELVETGSALE